MTNRHLKHFSIRVTARVKRGLERWAKDEGHESTSLIARTILTRAVDQRGEKGRPERGPMASTGHLDTR
jgi:hypothetical protein